MAKASVHRCKRDMAWSEDAGRERTKAWMQTSAPILLASRFTAGWPAKRRTKIDAVAPKLGQPQRPSMSDIDTVLVDSLKALDPKRPIREADIARLRIRPCTH